MIHKTTRTLLAIALLLCAPQTKAVRENTASSSTALAAPSNASSPYTTSFSDMSIGDLEKEKTDLEAEIDRRKNDCRNKSAFGWFQSLSARRIAAATGILSFVGLMSGPDNIKMQASTLGCNPAVAAGCLLALPVLSCLCYSAVTLEEEGCVTHERMELKHTKHLIIQKKQQCRHAPLSAIKCKSL